MAVPVPNRNAESWTALHETWEFTPDGPDNYLVNMVTFEPEVIVPIGKLSSNIVNTLA